eukprot:CAMPEP_0168567090 /NCGR_PEP_ID=MMETSP0413-20121227/14801_1 /TAXON_ID=136452 /ORGANISM="Filamoeba nolandi, Strain NC-AS-23-1" /LENGTH=407 /DNA_ID=CAMNT_0008599221 /DNA_START=185 /DNA_END=1408 /DNA_ORIENTATION=+
MISTKSGFSEPREVKILFEELFYNKQYKPFRVICIEYPLEGGQRIKVTQDGVRFPSFKSLSNCISFLKSFPENVIVLAKIREQLQEFNNTYVLVKGYESHVIKKVESFVDQAFEALCIANADFRTLYNNNDPNLIELRQITESFVMGELHKRLFEGLATIFSEEDDDMHSQLLKLQYLSASELGIREDLQCDFSDALKELKRLDECSTPLEKILCIQETNNKATIAITNHLSANNQKPDSFITTDDLIPIFAYLLIRSKLSTLNTNLYYMENFTFSEIGMSALGFTIVTFRAAVEYLKSFQNPAITFAPKTRASNSNSFVLPNNSRRLSQSEDRDPRQTKLSNTSETLHSNRTPHSIGNATNVPTSIGLDRNFQPPPDVITLNESEEIGEFLSQLRSDSSSSSKRRF